MQWQIARNQLGIVVPAPVDGDDNFLDDIFDDNDNIIEE